MPKNQMSTDLATRIATRIRAEYPVIDYVGTDKLAEVIQMALDANWWSDNVSEDDLRMRKRFGHASLIYKNWAPQPYHNGNGTCVHGDVTCLSCEIRYPMKQQKE